MPGPAVAPYGASSRLALRPHARADPWFPKEHSRRTVRLKILHFSRHVVPGGLGRAVASPAGAGWPASLARNRTAAKARAAVAGARPASKIARLPTETPKSYAAFLAYVAMGGRRSVREAARQYHSKTIAAGEISSAEDTTAGTWMGWSAKHKWVMSRSLARDEWIARTSDEQIVVNVKACMLDGEALSPRGRMTS